MRKTMKRILACTLAAALSLGTAVASMAAAPSPTVPMEPVDHTNITSDDGFYTVSTNKKGTATLKGAKRLKKKTKMSVPGWLKVQGVRYKVTRINGKSLKNWTKVKTLIFSKNVTLIKKYAFSNCKSLKTIVLRSKNVTNVKKNAFKGLNTKKMTVKIKGKLPLKKFKKQQANLRKAGFKGAIKRG